MTSSGYHDEDFDRLLAGPASRAAMSAEDLAKVLGTFRRSIIAEGFNPDETWDLCREFFLAMLEPEENRGDDD